MPKPSVSEAILNTVTDLVSNFLYYDRKSDEDLSAEALQKAVAVGVITIDEIVEKFRSELENGLPSED